MNCSYDNSVITETRNEGSLVIKKNYSAHTAMMSWFEGTVNDWFRSKLFLYERKLCYTDRNGIIDHMNEIRFTENNSLFPKYSFPNKEYSISGKFRYNADRTSEGKRRMSASEIKEDLLRFVNTTNGEYLHGGSAYIVTEDGLYDFSHNEIDHTHSARRGGLLAPGNLMLLAREDNRFKAALKAEVLLDLEHASRSFEDFNDLLMHITAPYRETHPELWVLYETVDLTSSTAEDAHALFAKCYPELAGPVSEFIQLWGSTSEARQKLDKAREKVLRWRREGKSKAEVCRRLEVSSETLSRWLDDQGLNWSSTDRKKRLKGSEVNKLKKLGKLSRIVSRTRAAKELGFSIERLDREIEERLGGVWLYEKSYIVPKEHKELYEKAEKILAGKYQKIAEDKGRVFDKNSNPYKRQETKLRSLLASPNWKVEAQKRIENTSEKTTKSDYKQVEKLLIQNSGTTVLNYI